MGATYNNTKQSKWLFVKLTKHDMLEMMWWLILDMKVSGVRVDTFMCFLTPHVNILPPEKTKVNVKGRALIFGASAVFGLCSVATQIQKWKSSLDVWHRGSFSIVYVGIVKGLVGVELDRASDLSVSQLRLQQEFIATHPAAPHSPSWLFAILPQTECRWNVLSLPLSLYCISHTCSYSTCLLSCILSPTFMLLFYLLLSV